MSSMPIIVIGENFASIGRPRIIDRVVECYYFRIVCTIVIIQIIQTRVISIDSSIDYGHGHSSASVAGVLPN